MRHKQAVTKVGLLMVLGFLVGAIAVAGPAPAVAGCTVIDQGTGTGSVVTCCSGQGFIVDLDGENAENVKLVGMGPAWFWAAADYERPQIGDTVTVKWNVVQCNTVQQNVLVSLDYVDDDNATVLSFRDENNVPLWKSVNRQVKRQQRLTRQQRTGQAE